MRVDSKSFHPLDEVTCKISLTEVPGFEVSLCLDREHHSCTGSDSRLFVDLVCSLAKKAILVRQFDETRQRKECSFGLAQSNERTNPPTDLTAHSRSDPDTLQAR
jgi:hypothetical protein